MTNAPMEDYPLTDLEKNIHPMLRGLCGREQFLWHWVYPHNYIPAKPTEEHLNLKKVKLEKLRQDGLALRTIRTTAYEIDDLEAAAVEALAAVKAMRKKLSTGKKLIDTAISIRLAQARLNKSLKMMNMVNYIIGNVAKLD